MKKFLDNDFCLNNETGKYLYHTYAENMPIIDYHCHLDAKDIAEDKKFDSLASLWLSGDHYKWRLMRADGVEEAFVTGDGDETEKIRLWARVLSKAIGNPLYAWSHMELKKYFGYDGILKYETVNEVLKACAPLFESGAISARKLIEKSNVTHICTTDDPVSDLRWHKALKEDISFKTKVLPSWRPDGILAIEKGSFKDYVKKLSVSAGIEIKDFDTFKKAIKIRLEYFQSMGCRTSDHGLERCFYEKCKIGEAEDIFKRKLNDEKLSESDCAKFKSAMLIFMAEEYCRYDWVMQLHYGCSRNVNSELFEALGADTGIDCINPDSPSRDLAKLLDAFNQNGCLPKTVVYSLDPSENEAIDTIIGCFQGKGKGYIQHGSAWWFNDHKDGMRAHLKGVAAGGVLGNFIGMLTDSRSFVSYTRHDYFRRIFCDLIGEWVEKGEYPDDKELLGQIIQDVCYNNAFNYFNLN